MDLEQKLQILSQLESSGGKNKIHAMQNSGIHKGTRSVSSYGLMPNTVSEFVKRNKAFSTTPVGQQIIKSMGNPEAINAITEDQNNDDAIMRALLQEQDERLKKAAPPDADEELLNVFAHRKGVSGAIKAAKDGSYKNDPYVKAYQQEKEKRFPKINSFLTPNDEDSE